MSILIHIKVKNLLTARVGAIVCSANNWLFLGTGSAGKIKQIAPKVQEECNVIIGENKGRPLPIGTATFTKGYNLTFGKYRRYVLHAIGLGYKKKVGNKVYERIHATPETIGNAVKNTLILAHHLSVSTIAFPLMCSRPGYSSFNPDEAPSKMLKIMVDAIKSFDKKYKHKITHVYICLDSGDLLGKLKHLATRLF